MFLAGHEIWDRFLVVVPRSYMYDISAYLLYTHSRGKFISMCLSKLDAFKFLVGYFRFVYRKITDAIRQFLNTN